MTSGFSSQASRRQFLAAGGATVAAACVAPRLFLEDRGDLVAIALKQAAVTKITVQPLRRNITALLGYGGISPCSPARRLTLSFCSRKYSRRKKRHYPPP